MLQINSSVQVATAGEALIDFIANEDGRFEPCLGGAVYNLTRALARGFGNDNIRVNSIEPGAVITERQKRLWYPSQDAIDNVVARQVIKRELHGDEIARTVLFLAADDSRMITKQSITVDAGLR